MTSTDDDQQPLLATQKFSPDLILLDMLLPTLGGPEVLRALKKGPTTARIPVIVPSSLPQNESFEKSKLNLDTNCNALLEVIKTTLDRNESSASQYSPPS